MNNQMKTFILYEHKNRPEGINLMGLKKKRLLNLDYDGPGRKNSSLNVAFGRESM